MSGHYVSTRADDEYLLKIIKLRVKYSAASIARAYGLKSERVRTICNRVLIDDIRASTKKGVETQQQVLAAYWELRT